MNMPIPIVALDVPTLAAAQGIVRQLDDQCDFYKVGLELFAAEGPRVVGWLRDENKRVFVDLKLHDIPNTVRKASRSVARLGATLLTVHASGGESMLRAAVEGANEGAADAERAGPRSGAAHAAGCGVLGVTVLTSMNASSLEEAWGRSDLEVEAEVLRLARLVQRAQALGVVCSGHELVSLRRTFGPGLATLVPGIRLEGGAAHDQQRTMTPDEAARAGADYLILGRAVTGAPNPSAAMAAVHSSLTLNSQLSILNSSVA